MPKDPKDPKEILINLAKKKTLTSSELSQFQNTFQSIADDVFRQRFAAQTKGDTPEHDTIVAIADRPNGARQGYNILEVALKAKNEQVVNYLMDRFEKSYTEPDRFLEVAAAVPPQLPINNLLDNSNDLKKDLNLRTYVVGKDGGFEFKREGFKGQFAAKARKTQDAELEIARTNSDNNSIASSSRHSTGSGQSR